MEQKKPLILVVDDMPQNIRILGSVLRNNDYDVAVVVSGQEALDFARETPPDLILLDIMMPDMDGYETCHRLKADPFTADIPVIFVSALRETDDKVIGFEAGAVDYITKPFSKDEVLARVRAHLELGMERERSLTLISAFEQAPISILIANPDARITYANQFFCRLNGYSLDEILGQNPRILKSGTHDTVFYEQMWQVLTEGSRWEGEIQNRKKNGELYWESVQIAPVFDQRERLVGYIATKQDITQRKFLEAQLEELSITDALTGIFNRRYGIATLEKELHRCQRNNTQLTVVFIDVDNLKMVNDNFGHADGDKLILAVTNSIKELIRLEDVFCRMGGDEFMLVMPECSRDKAEERMQEARLSLKGSAIGGYPIDFSFGFSEYLPSSSKEITADALIDIADKAMYVMKTNKKAVR